MRAEESLTNSFIHRVLWWLAVICLAQGTADLFHLLILFAGGYIRFPALLSPALESPDGLRYAGTIGKQACGLLLVIGAGGILARKSWPRHVLTIWACLSILLGLMTSFGQFGLIMRSGTPPTSQATTYSYRALYYVWNGFVRGPILSSSFPLLTMAILWQREVRELWSRTRRRAFEVLPMAELADGSNPRDRVEDQL